MCVVQRLTTLFIDQELHVLVVVAKGLQSHLQQCQQD